jgi:ubiquinone/menaquinone biosynthesis C-methylase UbiE
MAYNEKVDIEQHSDDVAGLKAIVQSLGQPVTGYSLALDIGGGLGDHAAPLQEMAQKVYVTDIIDYSSIYDGKLTHLVGEKYARNGVAYDVGRTEFHKVNAQSLIYRDGLFDLVFSVNAFEHIPDPKEALREAVRVCRPGGTVMLQFDPLWHSAFGHHLWGLNFAPWDHLLLSQAEMYQEIFDRDGGEESIHIFDHETNRVPASVFKSIFEAAGQASFSRWHFDYWAKSPDDDVNTQHPNFAKCLAAGYPQDELLIRGMQFVGVRA